MDDKEIARKYLITSLTIKNLELDLQYIKNGQFKIQGPYVQLIEGMISKAIRERRELKQKMYKRRIQVVKKYTQGDFTTYQFILNQNVEDVTYINQKLKKDVESQIKYLLTIRK